jgi:arylsulfatase
MADQFRADAIGSIGAYTRTPNLDRLAGEGWLFTNAFANSPECIPSRISLAVGLYPHQTGVDQNMRCTLDPSHPNWMQAIAAAGYRTSFFGKSHLHPHEGDIRDRLPLMHKYGLQTVDETTGPHASASVRSNMTELWERRGLWDTFRADIHERHAKPFVARPSPLPLDLYYDCYVGGRARAYLETLSSGPWFCCVSFGGPHEPWDAPAHYATMYATNDMPAPRPRMPRVKELRGLLKQRYSSTYFTPDLNNDDIAALRANYAGNVTLIDDQIGEIVGILRRRGELDRTLVVFTSDHGEMNGDYGLLYKSNFFDPAIKIPLIIAPPRIGGRKATGKLSSALVELMDVGATLTDYADAQPMPSQARSLRPLVEDRKSAHRPISVSEFAGHTCAITPELKIEFDPHLNPVLAFDRIGDAEEQNDVSQDVNYQHAITVVRNRIISFRQSTPNVAACVQLPSVQAKSHTVATAARMGGWARRALGRVRQCILAVSRPFRPGR